MSRVGDDNSKFGDYLIQIKLLWNKSLRTINTWINKERTINTWIKKKELLIGAHLLRGKRMAIVDGM